MAGAWKRAFLVKMHLSAFLLLLSFSVTLNGLEHDAVSVQKVSFMKEVKCNDMHHRWQYKVHNKNIFNCKEPVDAVIELEDEGGMHTIMPKRVIVKRCSRSCSEPQSCMPIKTVKRKIAVLRTHIARKQLTCGWVTVEDHVNCACGCRVMKKDCENENHMYDSKNCNCYCMNMNEGVNCSAKGRVWHNPTCSCNCRNQTAECTSGQHFDNDTCKCV